MKKTMIGIVFLMLLSLLGCETIDLSNLFNRVYLESDFESIEDETDGPLIAFGEVSPNTTYIDGDSPHALYTNRAIDVWKNMTRTKYVHNADKVIDEENGIYKFDCSGFTGQIVLEKVLPDHYKDLEDHIVNIIGPDGEDMHLLRPLAGTFYDYFRDDVLQDPDNLVGQNEYWKVFTSIDSLERGDLIIVRYDDDWRQETGNSTTGHVMIAWEIGSVNDHVVQIQVMDATSSAHTTSADTRTMNNPPVAEELNGKNSGIGFGMMKYLISTNNHRRPYAYKWSLNSKYWYNLVSGDNISEPDEDRYDRLEGIIFARPI